MRPAAIAQRWEYTERRTPENNKSQFDSLMWGSLTLASMIDDVCGFHPVLYKFCQRKLSISTKLPEHYLMQKACKFAFHTHSRNLAASSLQSKIYTLIDCATNRAQNWEQGLLPLWLGWHKTSILKLALTVEYAILPAAQPILFARS